MHMSCSAQPTEVSSHKTDHPSPPSCPGMKNLKSHQARDRSASCATRARTPIILTYSYPV